MSPPTSSMNSVAKVSSKTLKSKRGTNYWILLAIFFACALGLFVLHDKSLSETVPSMNKLLRRGPIVPILLGNNENNQMDHQSTSNTALILPQVKFTARPALTLSEYNTIRRSSAEIRLSTLQSLQGHPLHDFPNNGKGVSVEQILVHMHEHPKCKNIPLIITMAKVGSPIYWQLVENFQYTMAKYDLSECSLLICLDDAPCLQMCKDASFPCFNYEDTDTKKVSTFQQIAKLKLKDIPQALKRNVSMLVVDLDVGFRQHPLKLVGSFLDEDQDVRVQKDIVFIMNRTLEGWRTWYTRDLPNLGLFLCKGNQRVANMFDTAWNQYQVANTRRIDQPGTDQAIVQGAMLAHRRRNTLDWNYLPDQHVVLIDKVFKFETTAIELGGEITAGILTNRSNNERDTIAVHGTCYELKSKVNGLKAAGAFWDPFYYEPTRRTITMKLLYEDHKQFQRQVLSLVWLAVASNRTLIVPNVLTNSIFNSFLNTTGEGQVLWPGFRVVHTKDFTSSLQIVEPGYYWRMAQDFTDAIPPPVVVSTTSSSLPDILSELKKYTHIPRIVLNASPTSPTTLAGRKQEQELIRWANSSVGVWEKRSFDEELAAMHALKLPGSKPPGSNKLVTDTHRLCAKILVKPRGNRSCFDKCK